MKQLIITLNEDNKLEVQANEPLTLPTTIDLALSAVLAMMNSTIAHAPEEAQQEIKEFLFDTFNIAASALLAQFAPDLDLRPDITEEAVLIKELELANEKLNSNNHAN